MKRVSKIFMCLAILPLCMMIVLSGCGSHTHEWSEATCTSPKTCTVCGEKEGEPLGHTWQAATCIKAKTCSTCGATEGKAAGHSWQAATCTKPKTCSICGITDGTAQHTWQAATCIKAKTCSTCGATEGKAAGHSWQAATCTKPKTCSICNQTEGRALGHTWVAATCTAPKICSVCGTTEGNIVNHVDAGNGKCKYCNQDILLLELQKGFSVQLFIPTVGGMNCYCVAKYTNLTHYEISINMIYFVANGKILHNPNRDNDYSKLGQNQYTTVTFYRSDSKYYDKFDSKYYDMYLDNNSLAHTYVLVNGKKVYINFGVNGPVAFGYSSEELGIY